ncbi:MAG: flagellar hook-associated protein FlgK [Pseudomonadota bacterium]
MSISSALINAKSGLTASSRGVEVVSNNISNALTPGYVRRDVVLSSLSLDGLSGGVRVAQVERQTNAVATADRRAADSQLAANSIRADVFQRINSVLGEPGDAFGLASRFDQFDTALSRAITSPESRAVLSSVVSSARALAGTLRAAAEVTAAVRIDADANIATQVRSLNEAMQDVVRLNGEIRTRAATGADVNALIDARDRALDSISQSVPIRVVRRDADQIAVFTTGGAALVDGKAAEFGFTQSRIITADMSVEEGDLSRLTFNGADVPDGLPLFSGGALAEQFAVRDVVAPAWQGDLDAIAADLALRSASADPTVPTGDPGLFTDGGDAVDGSAPPGLANRLSVNSAVVASEGGEPEALRDGLMSVAPRASGDPTLLQDLRAVLSDRLSPPDGASDPRSLSVADRLAGTISQIARGGNDADQTLSFARAMSSDLLTEELRLTGVDTDQELQSLIALEEAYAANARVLSVADDLIQLLLEL